MRHTLFILILLAASAHLVQARPGRAESAPFEFHGLRMGMSPAEVEAAGFHRLREVISILGTNGYVLGTGSLPEVVRLTGYFYQERLFQLAATYRPRDEAAARAFAREIFRRYGEPDEVDDVMRVAVRWKQQRLTFHFGIVRDDGKIYTPSLMITEDAAYQKVLSQVPEQNCGMAEICASP